MREVQRLGPEHTEAVVAAQPCYPAAQRQSREEIRQKLALLASSKQSFSWALVQDGTVVAFIVAYPTKSSVEGHEDEVVISVDEVFVVPGVTGVLYRLLKLLQLGLKAAHMDHLVLEGFSRSSFFTMIEQHPGVFRRLGYEVVRRYAYWDEDAGEEMLFARYAPLSLSPGD